MKLKTGAVYFFLSIFAFSSGGCYMLSKSGREQHAYAKYVRRSSITRIKQRARFTQQMPQLPKKAQEPSEPTVNTEVSSGPQSVTAATGDGQ